MLAKTARPFSKPGWFFAIKYDGYRLLARKDGKHVELTTRNDTVATSWYPQIVRSLMSISGSFVMDCEVCAVDQDGKPDFEALRPRINGVAPGRIAALFCFDLLFRKYDTRPQPLVDRLKLLRDLLEPARENLAYVHHIPEAGAELYQQAALLGLEGIVAKRRDSPYVAGRSAHWLKIKQPGYHHGWTRGRSQ